MLYSMQKFFSIIELAMYEIAYVSNSFLKESHSHTHTHLSGFVRFRLGIQEVPLCLYFEIAYVGIFPRWGYFSSCRYFYNLIFLKIDQ